MTKKTPEQEPIIHPLTGEILPSESAAIACVIAQFDSIEADLKSLTASHANSPDYCPERAQLIADGIKAARDMRTACKQLLAELAEAERRDFGTDED